jgi:tetratricopeptide (TPR) repeat protein
MEESKRVISAYAEAIRVCPGTDVAAYCGLGLSGFYCYLHDYDEAISQAKQVAEECAGTADGLTALLVVGTIYNDAYHDPAAAAEWFARIPEPPGVASADQYGPPESLHFAAQVALAKCELQMGRAAEAEARYGRIAARYPQYAPQVEHEREFETSADRQRRAALDPQGIIDRQISGGRHFAVLGDLPPGASDPEATRRAPLETSPADRQGETHRPAPGRVLRHLARVRGVLLSIGLVCVGTGVVGLVWRRAGRTRPEAENVD